MNTFNVGDKFKVKSTALVNKRWLDCVGTIISVHTSSGCYVCLINGNKITLFEHEIELLPKEDKSKRSYWS